MNPGLRITARRASRTKILFRRSLRARPQRRLRPRGASCSGSSPTSVLGLDLDKATKEFGLGTVRDEGQ